jgi:hypothetical protein
MLQNWNLYKEVFYSGVVCVYNVRVGGVFIGSQGWSCGKNWARGIAADGLAGRPGLGGEPTTFPWILSYRHMKMYSHRGLDPVGYKVGPASQGVGRPLASRLPC